MSEAVAEVAAQFEVRYPFKATGRIKCKQQLTGTSYIQLQDKATVKEAKKDKKAERVSLPPQQHCRFLRQLDQLLQPRQQQKSGTAQGAACLGSKAIGRWFDFRSCDVQAQQRGVKQAAPTQPDPDDPCAANYGDYAMVQSTEITGRKWTKVEQLTPELAGQKVGCG